MHVEGANADNDEPLAHIAMPSSPAANHCHRRRVTSATIAVASIAECELDDLPSTKKLHTVRVEGACWRSNPNNSVPNMALNVTWV
jgi:hypothetical protein